MARLVHQITSGVAGWLTFEQMRNGIDNLREAELAKPLELIAQGRAFEAKGEFPLPKEAKKPGAPKCIDFVMVNRTKKLVVAIELKYKRTDKKMAGSVGKDASRLHNVTIDIINAQINEGLGGAIKQPVKGFKLTRAVIFVWHDATILSHIKSEPPVIRDQFIKLFESMLPAGVEPNFKNYHRAMLGTIANKPVGRKAGSLRAGSTITHKRFWVASLLNSPKWSEI